MVVFDMTSASSFENVRKWVRELKVLCNLFSRIAFSKTKILIFVVLEITYKLNGAHMQLGACESGHCAGLGW
jgi:hypothetical protein